MRLLRNKIDFSSAENICCCCIYSNNQMQINYRYPKFLLYSVSCLINASRSESDISAYVDRTLKLDLLYSNWVKKNILSKNIELYLVNWKRKTRTYWYWLHEFIYSDASAYQSTIFFSNDKLSLSYFLKQI